MRAKAGEAAQVPQHEDGGSPAAPPTMRVARKNPGVAVLISFFVPGGGSLYAGKTNAGLTILFCYLMSWLLTLVFIGIFGIVGFWIWGMIDAYRAAQAWNRAWALNRS
jgi:TM2 domain-containing membrane protein YozV